MFLLKFIKSSWVQRDKFRKHQSMLIGESVSFTLLLGIAAATGFGVGGVGCLWGEGCVFDTVF